MSLKVLSFFEAMGLRSTGDLSAECDMAENPLILKKIYSALFKTFGPQEWWPGDTQIEIIVGAILTQNTNWGNVERAILNLKDAGVLSARGLHEISVVRLATLIRPSGYFNIKARRLKNFIEFLFQEYQGSLRRMGRAPLTLLRQQLLSVNGIGPETADSILLYAFAKLVFVVDAYTRRYLARHRLIQPDATYEEIQRFFMRRLRAEAQFFNEYHALIVKLGKNHCRSKPRCEICPLLKLLGRPILD